MKPFDDFIGRMLESARLVRANDPNAATAVIQKALRDAGLMPPQAGAMPDAPADAPAEARSDDGARPFVDLNEAPSWSVPPRGGAKAKARFRRAERAEAYPHARSDARPDPRAAAQPDPAAPGAFVEGSHACAAGTRRYRLYVPTRPAAPRPPLVVMLHGCTQNAADFATGTGMNALAEREGCLVLYPEQDRAANHSVCWNWFDQAHQRRDGGEAAILAGMVRQVVQERGADPARVFVAGMSAGGAMAAVLGAAYPDLFAAVGVHSGLPAGCARDMVTGLHAMKQPRRAAGLRKAVPVIVFHGDGDHVVHPDNGDAVLRQFVDAHGASVQERHERLRMGGRGVSKTVWHDAAGTALAEHWVLHGAAHAWSGGDPRGSHTDAAGPNASEEMLRFFLQ